MRKKGRRPSRRWWWAGLALVVMAGAVAWPIGCGHQQPAAPVVTAGGRPVVRVRIAAKAPQILLAATAPPAVRVAGGSPQTLNFPPKALVPVTLTAAGWHVGAVALPPGELAIEPAGDGSVTVDGTAYRGTYHFVPVSDAAFDVINRLDIESYLKGVLAGEAIPTFDAEAFAAQAVVSRTYALYVARTAPPARAWDLHADTKSQVYGGMRAETPKAVAAADATAGIVLAYGPPGGEKIFKTYFSSCCGGASQSAADAFREPAFEPFTERRVGPRCDTSAGKYQSKFSWGPVVVSKAELSRRFRAYGKTAGRPEKSIGAVQRIDVLRANAAGRPVQFVVTDDRNVSYVLGGEDFRWAVNTGAPPDSTLPSSYVTPVTTPADVRFENGHGYGHGVGLCQWCAQAQAHAGAGHEEIVRSAYRGAVLVRAY